MLNGSNIVKWFQLGKTDCGYYVAYGIGLELRLALSCVSSW